MKHNSILKSLVVAVILLVSFSATNAQQTTGDVTKQADINYGVTTTGGAIKLIDNKGTIKYLQAKNGITLLTNQTADKTVTTWQLGGTLTNNTYIDVAGQAFALDGIKLESGAASTNATDASSHGTGTGWTLLVRDEASGETRKMLATSLIQSGETTTTSAGSTTTITATGMSANASRVWVYRNGAKLVQGVDFTVAADLVTLTPSGWADVNGDVYEVQWIK